MPSTYRNYIRPSKRSRTLSFKCFLGALVVACQPSCSPVSPVSPDPAEAHLVSQGQEHSRTADYEGVILEKVDLSSGIHLELYTGTDYKEANLDTGDQSFWGLLREITGTAPTGSAGGIFSSDDRVMVRTSSLNFEGFKRGDHVRVWTFGFQLDSYPAQVFANRIETLN